MSNLDKGSYVLSKHAGAIQPYHWVLRASNNEIILTSETYVTKSGAEQGISSCRTNSQFDSKFEKRSSVANQPYFVLKAENGQIIGTSEMYSTTSARDNGIASVKRFGKDALLIDRC